MSVETNGYEVLLPSDQYWRNSNIMKIPNTNLTEGLGVNNRLGGRLWRMPPFSANTWHRHIDSWEFYFVLEGEGRIRVGTTTLLVPRYGSVIVAPHMLRQVFNDTADEALWLIIGAPQESRPDGVPNTEYAYPEDPSSLPPELSGHIWPPG